MGTPVINDFTSYNLSEREVLDASVLNPILIQYMQSQRASVAEQLLDLKFTQGQEFAFAQEQAFLQGQLSIYRTLIESSAEAYTALVDLARHEAESGNSSFDFA